MASIITQAYEYISKEENQERASAAARAFIGISSVYFSPGCAMLGASGAAISPDLVSLGLNYIDTAVNGLWNSLDFKQKIGTAGIGIVIGLASTIVISLPLAGTVIAIPPSFFSAKVGAEMVLRNLKR